MKRVDVLIIVLVLAVVLVSPVNANDLVVLSNMTESECIEFVKQNGIEIPNDYDENIWGAFIKQTIIAVESDPYCEFHYNYTVTQEFANRIKCAVNEYYGIDTIYMYAISPSSVPTSTAETLFYSIPLSEWNSSFAYYNCYIFALGLPEVVYEDPGYFSGETFSLLYDVEGIAELVKRDLQHQMHQRIHISTDIDTSNLCVNERIICVRKSTYDYHFMKYDVGEWFHKPGQSAVLRFLEEQGVDSIWTNEGLFDSGIITGDTNFDSEIYYISYDGHAWEFTSSNNGTHSKHCNVCGDTFVENCNLVYTSAGVNHHTATCADCGYTTPTQACTYSYTGNGDGTHEKACTLCGNSMDLPCEMTYEYLMYNQHRAECTLCGDVIAEDCTAVATYCGDGSTNHIHADACRDCGNAMSSATESCTLEYVFAGTVNGVNTHSRVCAECDYVHTASAACVYRLGDYCFFCGTHRDTQQVASLDDPNTKE